MNNQGKKFEVRIRSAILECHRLGYYPTRFEQMLRLSDAVHLAKKLVTSGDLQDGLKKLKSLNGINDINGVRLD